MAYTGELTTDRPAAVAAVYRLHDLAVPDLMVWLDSPLAGLPSSPRLDTLITAPGQVGWWWPVPGTVILTERPVAVGPEAVVYAGGFRVSGS